MPGGGGAEKVGYLPARAGRAENRPARAPLTPSVAEMRSPLIFHYHVSMPFTPTIGCELSRLIYFHWGDAAMHARRAGKKHIIAGCRADDDYLR